MKIEDSFEVAAPRERVWRLITDPGTVAGCVPGCGGVEVVSDTLYRAKVSVKVGPIKAAFNMEVEVIEETPPEEVRSKTRGEEGSRASTVSSDNLLRLEVIDDDTTRVHYAAEVSVVGRLGKFGLGVMKKKAESLGRDFAACFKEKAEMAEASA
jgi:hypothetical protein